MKKKVHKKILFASTILTTAFLSIPTFANVGTWKKEGLDFKYYNKDGKYLTSWLKEGDKWYYLDPANGKLKTGWQYIDGKWYFLNPTKGSNEGAMLTGWNWIDGNCYFLEESGALTVNAKTKDGYMVDKDGKWVENNKVVTVLGKGIVTKTMETKKELPESKNTKKVEFSNSRIDTNVSNKDAKKVDKDIKLEKKKTVKKAENGKLVAPETIQKPEYGKLVAPETNQKPEYGKLVEPETSQKPEYGKLVEPETSQKPIGKNPESQGKDQMGAESKKEMPPAEQGNQEAGTKKDEKENKLQKLKEKYSELLAIQIDSPDLKLELIDEIDKFLEDIKGLSKEEMQEISSEAERLSNLKNKLALVKKDFEKVEQILAQYKDLLVENKPAAKEDKERVNAALEALSQFENPISLKKIAPIKEKLENYKKEIEKLEKQSEMQNMPESMSESGSQSSGKKNQGSQVPKTQAPKTQDGEAGAGDSSTDGMTEDKGLKKDMNSESSMPESSMPKSDSDSKSDSMQGTETMPGSNPKKESESEAETMPQAQPQDMGSKKEEAPMPPAAQNSDEDEEPIVGDKPAPGSEVPQENQVSLEKKEYETDQNPILNFKFPLTADMDIDIVAKTKENEEGINLEKDKDYIIEPSKNIVTLTSSELLKKLLPKTSGEFEEDLQVSLSINDITTEAGIVEAFKKSHELMFTYKALSEDEVTAIRLENEEPIKIAKNSDLRAAKEEIKEKFQENRVVTTTPGGEGRANLKWEDSLLDVITDANVDKTYTIKAKIEFDRYAKTDKVAKEIDVKIVVGNGDGQA